MDGALRLSRLSDHLSHAVGVELARALTASRDGRKRGNGTLRSTFFRDGDYRLEASARLDISMLTGGDVVALLDSTPSYLTGAWGRATSTPWVSV